MTKIALELLRIRIAEAICSHLEPIFSAEMMLTLVVRHPTNAECFIVIGSDSNLGAVADLVRGKNAVKSS